MKEAPKRLYFSKRILWIDSHLLEFISAFFSVSTSEMASIFSWNFAIEAVA